MKILMVCLGNICRSPIAEGVLRHKLKEKNIQAEVDSAGTGSWHSGEAPDKRAILVAKKHGVDIASQRARQIRQEDFQSFDKIYAADQEILNHLKRLAGQNEKFQKKIDLLLNASNPGSGLPVPDPYYGDESDFEHVFLLIEKTCDAICEQLK